MEKKRKAKGHVVYELTDGTSTTCDQMVEATGWARSTCYSRLCKSNDPAIVYKSLSPTRRDGHVVYTLDDGSEWSAKSLAEHLGCSKSRAGGRLCTMKGESARILKPIDPDSMIGTNNKEVDERISKRMFFDVLGHWSLLNRCL
ncbi:MAG: hypothetical protein NZ811_01975 [Gammaproteobacteria bacterium]|nr:hypothetical protein [Gammaproteobacteria bacterium]